MCVSTMVSDKGIRAIMAVLTFACFNFQYMECHFGIIIPMICLKKTNLFLQIPICAECILTDHKPPLHQPERIQDIEEVERDLLKTLISESKSKISSCEEATNTLMGSLTELASQRDNAKDLINETFQSYKAMLEKKRV